MIPALILLDILVPLNRTIVELKLLQPQQDLYVKNTLNRTIVELKSAEAGGILLSNQTLNRTIVELKYCVVCSIHFNLRLS